MNIADIHEGDRVMVVGPSTHPLGWAGTVKSVDTDPGASATVLMDTGRAFRFTASVLEPERLSINLRPDQVKALLMILAEQIQDNEEMLAEEGPDEYVQKWLDDLSDLNATIWAQLPKRNLP
jgi:hypothetical protein